MAILINDNYSLQACKPFDARYLNICAPWTSVSAVNAAIPTYRYTGLTVNIMGTEYWYKDGVADSCLIVKSLGGTISSATNGLSLYSGGTSMGLGGTILSGTTITLAIGSSLSFTDSRSGVNQKGIQYTGDYSANFTCLSIPNVGYVTGITNTVHVYCQSTTANYTATALNDYIGAQSGSTICLPSSPKACQKITVTDVSGHALECMIVVCGNGKCINGADCATVNTDYGSVTLVNNGNSWSAIAFIN